MSGNSTVVQIGSAAVSTTGGLTGKLLDQLKLALVGVNTTNTSSVSTPGTSANPITIPSGTGAVNISTADSGLISVPSGYQFVVYQGSGTLTGGNANTVVIGDLNYRGSAGTVIGTGTGSGTVVDTTAGAQFAMATGNELVFGLGNNQTFQFDSGYSTLVAGNSVQSGSSEAVSVDGTASVIGFYVGATDFMQTGGSETMYAGAGVSTLMAMSGNTVFFGSNAGDVVSLGSGNAEILNTNETGAGAGITSVMAGTGSDTIFAQGGVNYHGGSGNSFFIGGPGSSTVYTAANETAFGGTGGDVVSVAAGSKLLFIGVGGADTIMGGTIAPTVWGNTNEQMTVADSVQSGIYILYGNNDQMNLASTGGHSHIIGLDGGAFAGNATLTMSTAGNDSLVLFSPNQFGMTGATHTLTVANWQASDLLDLTFASINGQTFGYTQSNVSAAQAALSAGHSFTLADGTTVMFTGAKPTTIAHI